MDRGIFMERWLWVTKDVICWEKLSEMEIDDELELCNNQPFKMGDKIIVYRSGNHRDLPYIFEVKKILNRFMVNLKLFCLIK